MGLYDPPQVNVDIGNDDSTHWVVTTAALIVPWLMTVVCLYFVTPAITEGMVASIAPDVETRLRLTLGMDLLIDAVFVALGTYWAIQLSRLRGSLTALFFGISLIAVRAIELGGLPGVISTGLPLWYDVLGNFNDLAGAFAALLSHQIFNRELSRAQAPPNA
jgi:hypothetical protein